MSDHCYRCGEGEARICVSCATELSHDEGRIIPPGDLYTAQPWFVVRGFRDAGGHGEHYTIDDDYLTIYPDGGDDFDPEASNWIQVYGPDQEKVARLISAVGIMRDALERIAGGQPRNHLLTERGAIADGIDYATYEQGVNDALHWAQGVAMVALAAVR